MRQKLVFLCGLFLGLFCFGLSPVKHALAMHAIDADGMEKNSLQNGKIYLETELDCLGSGSMRYKDAYAVLDLVNQQRKKAGLGILLMDQDLLSTANVRAMEITKCFSHQRPDGTSCFTAYPSAGYRGENIAYGYPSAKDVMRGWMNSSGHRANILDEDFKSIGIGCYEYKGVYYWVQCFSSQKAKVVKDAEAAKEFFDGNHANNSVDQVRNIVLKPAKRKITIVWEKQEDVNGYQIQIAPDKKFKATQRTSILIKGNQTTYKVLKDVAGKRLKSKKTYYVRIRSYRMEKENGKTKKAYSKWVTKSKKTK